MKTLSEDRRALHRIPETGCRLPETAAYLRGALAEMPCTLLAPWEDAVCAYFDLGKDETVAVRSDMDALPVTERTVTNNAGLSSVRASRYFLKWYAADALRYTNRSFPPLP